MNMLPPLEIQTHIPVTAPSSLPARRICQSRHSDPTRSSNQIPSRRVSQQIVLQLTQNLACRITRQPVQSLRTRKRFDEYHNVGYTTL